jgi:hypothetical protein
MFVVNISRTTTARQIIIIAATIERKKVMAKTKLTKLFRVNEEKFSIHFPQPNDEENMLGILMHEQTSV